jgi:SAM-dependent methyltransferase
MEGTGDSSQPWLELARDYERARTREDSLDRLVEWPAQRALLGDITGRSVLDVGCGNGSKLAELVENGAAAAVGIDISGTFVSAQPSRLQFVQGDLSELESVPELTDRTFDRILFLPAARASQEISRVVQRAE